MRDIVLLTFLSFSWIIFSWLVLYFSRSLRWYIAPYLTFQLGSTLFVCSLAFIKGWAGIGFGSLGLAINVIALFLLLIVWIYYFSKKKNIMDDTEHFEEA